MIHRPQLLDLDESFPRPAQLTPARNPFFRSTRQHAKDGSGQFCFTTSFACMFFKDFLLFLALSRRYHLPCLHRYFDHQTIASLLFQIQVYALYRGVLRSRSQTVHSLSLSFCLLSRALITGRFTLALSSIFSLFLYRLCIFFKGGVTHSIYDISCYWLFFFCVHNVRNSFIFLRFCLLCVFVCCNNIIPHTFCFVLLLFCVF